MWNGKLKAVTFSYDDGVLQDKRLIEIFNKYGLKATFNLNSELFDNGPKKTRWKVQPHEVRNVYEGHEVAVHTLTHPRLTELDDDEIIRQVEQDRKNLEELVGYSITGMAYPCGGVNNDDRVAGIIRDHTPIRYARTITSTYSFDLQDNLYRFNPTVYHIELDKLFELGEEFLNSSPDKPQLFYIWGHSYEFDELDESQTGERWKKFEELCRMISGHKDIFYGTNRQVLL
ncbi:MAG: polysaccharide deacetylase family protein [Clostridia bacterium]|nr:polysaccharide deacetylase family protein [Clostridia bacterium]